MSGDQWNGLLEGFVNWSVPADEGHGGEEDEPKDGQTKVDTSILVCSEVSQTCQHVEEQSGAVDFGQDSQTENKSWKSNNFKGETDLSAHKINKGVKLYVHIHR